MTTFYVACYSGDGGDLARRRAHSLIAIGMRSAFDWWRNVNATKEEYPLLARHDVDAARHADLFVLDYSIATPGGMFELGVRIAAGKQAHVVCETPHFFFAHDLVRVHRSWQAFLAFLRPSELWPPGLGPNKPLMAATGDAPHGLYAVKPTVEAINHGLAAAAGCSFDSEHDGPCEDSTKAPVTLQELKVRVARLERATFGTP